MGANNSFTRDLAKQLLLYLFHHDPNMEDTELSNKNEGVQPSQTVDKYRFEQ